jgi:hypothetical protein
MSTSNVDKREAIYCSCHGDVVMGYRVNQQVIWYDTRHGVRHFSAIPVPTAEGDLDKRPATRTY